MKKDSPLTLLNLTKYYGSRRGVKNLNVELRKGEVFGFLGPNGAGKSTTIRTILNFINPTSGSIEVFGLDSIEDSVEIKEKVGYLSGDIALYKDMKGEKLLKFLSAFRKDFDWEYVKKLENLFEAQLDTKIRSLSKGNKQKLGIILAFMHKPELVILDEPTSGLDPLMKEVFYDFVKEVKAEGTTIFASSHDLQEVQKICDRAAFIREGELISIEDIGTNQTFQLKRYSMVFESIQKKSSFAKIENVKDVKIKNKTVSLTVQGSVKPLISKLNELDIVDLVENEATIEEVFMHYYK